MLPKCSPFRSSLVLLQEPERLTTAMRGKQGMQGIWVAAMQLCCCGLLVHPLHKGNNAALWHCTQVAHKLVPYCGLAHCLQGTVLTTCVSSGMLSVAGTGLSLLPPYPAHPCRSASARSCLFNRSQSHLSDSLHVIAEQLQMTLNHGPQGMVLAAVLGLQQRKLGTY